MIPGFTVVQSSHLGGAKLSLSDNVTVSKEFRERINQWLLECFGRNSDCVVDHVNRTCYVSPEVYLTSNRKPPNL